MIVKTLWRSPLWDAFLTVAAPAAGSLFFFYYSVAVAAETLTMTDVAVAAAAAITAVPLSAATTVAAYGLSCFSSCSADAAITTVVM